jgi:hypothetical protein
MFWSPFCSSLQVTAASPGFSVIALETELENVPNPTLIRQRGRILVYEQDRVGQTIDTCVSCGIYIADAKAITAGIASLELPLSNGRSDWVWWDSFLIASNYDAAGDIALDAPLIHDRGIMDGKAMRKIGQNQAVVFVAEATDQGGGVSDIRIDIAGRLLFKK